MAVEEVKLKEMNVRAGDKLVEVMANKERTQKKQAESGELEKELIVKQKAANDRKSSVEDQLADVEPQLEAAKMAVSGVGKKEINELKALRNPPEVVKNVLGSAVVLLTQGHSTSTDWKDIKAEVMKPTFLTDVMGLQADTVTPKAIKLLETKYGYSQSTDPHTRRQENDQYYDKANHASQVAGPLVKWAAAMMAYATILNNIEPLRNELATLVAEATRMQKQHEEVKELLVTLEKTLQDLTDEYNLLQKNIGKTEDALATTKVMVARSVQVLDSLKDERERWSKGSTEFDKQMETMVGDSLLAGAFLGYAGYFDQTYRQGLNVAWTKHFSAAGVKYKSGLSFPEFCSTPDERLEWKKNSLPDDALCTENAIMIKRFIRYPLIIDPAGQATDYVLKQYASTKISKTSFLDKAFRRKLENSLQFGTPLLVQDAECYDSLLNPVLNKETKRVGGDIFIDLGGAQEQRMSPAFNIMLTTRNTAHQFPPDVCSRVTMVNFTVTPGSLQAQCLNQVLRSERPDVEAKRTDLLRLQGEFRLRLRQLEKDLLRTLNEASGSILEDDTVLAALEKIKKEAGEVAQKVAESDGVMVEIETVLTQYKPLAQKCSAIYFTLEQLSVVHFMYRFALQFFLEIFHHVLGSPALKAVDDPAARLVAITGNLFSTTYERVAPGLAFDHRMPFAMTLAKFHLEGTADALPARQLDLFMSGGSSSSGASDFDFLLPDITPDQAKALHGLSKDLPCFGGLQSEMLGNKAATLAWAVSNRPEEAIPEFISGAKSGGDNNSAQARALHELLLLRAIRPDRLIVRCRSFVDAVFAGAIGDARDDPEYLQQVVEKEVNANTPILLVGE